MKRPKSLNDVWPEKDLCPRLGLSDVGKSGRSRTISAWIRDGLEHVEKSGIRYFSDQAVIDFLWGSETDAVG